MLRCFADVLLLNKQWHKALREGTRVVGMLRVQTNVEQIVESTVGCDDANISDTDPFIRI